MQRVVFGIACFFLFLSCNSTVAGMLSNYDSATDRALIDCLRAHPIIGEKDHTGQQALADAEVHQKQCESEIRASLLECRVAGKSDDVCVWALMAFMNQSVQSQ
ncbi:hypothetical protein [Rhizobium rhizogenes]|uniref:hypothetical protein n=1 Tax=Rhizobium rhizogenes TaxID=359 RepID=UPI00226E0E50|nr:hypothetical protein [Rhizobium rhizogenes]